VRQEHLNSPPHLTGESPQAVFDFITSSFPAPPRHTSS
jgi:hypothetical protein